jgi:upstream activation factor subunit UAF30
MARTKKPDTKSTVEGKTSAKKTTTSVSSKKVKKEVKAETPVVTSTEEPVMDNTVTDATVVTPTEVPDSSMVLAQEFTVVLSQVQALSQQLSTLKNTLRTLEKKAVRELKIANKASKKSKRAKGNRQPSGFVKPTLISNELADFLGKAKGTEMARTAVTKEINCYIREHSLQDPKNGRRIIPDNKLSVLLNIAKDEELTYFNLQKFMSPHFAKASSVQKTA